MRAAPPIVRSVTHGPLVGFRLLLLFRSLRSIAAGMISLSFPYLILQELHRSALTLGVLYTAGSIATAILGLVSGFLADIWGRKRTLLVIGMLLPISAALVFWSSKQSILLLAALLGGFSATGSLSGGGVGGAARPILNAVLSGLTDPAVRTKYFSIFTFASGLCAAAGMLCARLFVGREVFLVAAGIALSGVLLILPMRLRDAFGTPRDLPSKQVIGKFTLTGALNGFAQGLVIPFLIPFFVLVYHLPKAQMAVFGFAAGTLGAGALLLAPRLDRWWGFVKSIALTRGLGALLLVLLPMSPALVIALAIYMVTPALRVAAMPVQQSMLTGLVGESEVGRALGLNQVARLAASSGGITLGGYLLHTGRIGLPFYLYGAVMALNLFFYFRFFDGR